VTDEELVPDPRYDNRPEGPDDSVVQVFGWLLAAGLAAVLGMYLWAITF
jgi:hypothetical protein